MPIFPIPLVDMIEPSTISTFFVPVLFVNESNRFTLLIYDLIAAESM